MQYFFFVLMAGVTLLCSMPADAGSAHRCISASMAHQRLLSAKDGDVDVLRFRNVRAAEYIQRLNAIPPVWTVPIPAEIIVVSRKSKRAPVVLLTFSGTGCLTAQFILNPHVHRQVMRHMAGDEV